MNKFTLLRAAISRIPQARFLNREQMKHFWNEMTLRMRQFIWGLCGRVCDVFLLYNTTKGSILPVVLTCLRAKMCANDVPLSFGWSSADLRLAS
jgi:hypothetical protein